MTLKRIEVVMLATNKKANLAFNKITNKLGLYNRFIECTTDFKPQHLYFLSDDEIKEGDWFIDLRDSYNKIPYQCTGITSNFILCSSNEINHPKMCCKKIIATTDDSIGYTNLKVSPVPNFCTFPEPSKDFIKVYIEDYNKGNKIEQVDVEYEIGKCQCSVNSPFEECVNEYGTCTEYKLKVNSKNEISIRKIKDTWTREEVESLCRKAFLLYKSDNTGYPGLIKSTQESEDKWIEDNL